MPEPTHPVPFKSYVICPETITSPAPDYDLPANMPCGLVCELYIPSGVAEVRCARGHTFFATHDDLHIVASNQTEGPDA